MLCRWPYILHCYFDYHFFNYEGKWEISSMFGSYLHFYCYKLVVDSVFSIKLLWGDFLNWYERALCTIRKKPMIYYIANFPSILLTLCIFYVKVKKKTSFPKLFEFFFITSLLLAFLHQEYFWNQPFFLRPYNYNYF